MVDVPLAQPQRQAGKLLVTLLEPALQPASKHGCWRDTEHGWRLVAESICRCLPERNIRGCVKVKHREDISRLVSCARVMGLTGLAIDCRSGEPSSVIRLKTSSDVQGYLYIRQWRHGELIQCLRQTSAAKVLEPPSATVANIWCYASIITA
jgi:hypothetical protein